MQRTQQDKEVSRWWFIPSILAGLFIVGVPILVAKETGISYYTYSGNAAMGAWGLMFIIDILMFAVRVFMGNARSWIIVWPLIFIVEILITQFLVVMFLWAGCMPNKPCF